MENGLQVRKRLVCKIADLIDRNPSSVASALEYSNTFFEYPYTEKELVDTTANALVEDPLFRKNISTVIVYDENNLLNGVDFSNIGGKDARIDSGKATGDFAKTVGEHTMAWSSMGWVGNIIGAVVGVVDASFGLASKNKKADAAKEVARAEIYTELFDKKKKKNKNWWIPAVVVGSILVLGGVVVFITLKKK